MLQRGARVQVGKREVTSQMSPLEPWLVLILESVTWSSQGQSPPEAEGHTALPMHASAPLPIITTRDGRFTI